MLDAPYAVAVLAGMLAALNPCGFAMLPAYLTIVVADGGAPGRAATLWRAARMSAGMTAGFVAVFAGFGLFVVPLALSLQRYLPWATVVIGIALMLVGIALLLGRDLELRLPRAAGAAPGQTIGSMVGYGVAYAVASLSCTVGPFLAVTTSTLRSGSPLAAGAVFVTYALGMGLVVTTLAMAVALARSSLLAHARRLLPSISRVGGGLLLLAGAYVTYYGFYEIRVFGGGSTEDWIVGAAIAVQGRLAQALSTAGPWWVLAALLALAVAGIVGRRRKVSHGRSPVG